MSQSSTQSTGSGPDFHLPDEVLSVIPTDPYDQLDLARKITSMAIASRVSKLESENGRLKQKMYEKDRIILQLEEKLSYLEHNYQEAEARLRVACDDNVKLSRERDSLSSTAKKLGRDLTKLEAFKRQLMQSLSDDHSSQAETVDIGTCDQSVSKSFLMKDEGMNGHSTRHSFSGSTDSGITINDASRQVEQRYPMTPYMTPRLTPSGTPKAESTGGSPIRYSTGGSSQKTSGFTSPTRSQYEGQGSPSSWYPSSQQSSAANSPPTGRSRKAHGRIDGKEFFRQARSRLSYEQFSAFLANVKELNAQKQSREETLRKAEDIFGTDNKDLYLLFQGLLNRSIN